MSAMAVRLRRAEQVERNRGAVLEAARRVFIERGYAGAEPGGHCRGGGVLQRRCLLAVRQQARLLLRPVGAPDRRTRAQNERIVAKSAGVDALRELIRAANRYAGDSGWPYLLTEFRALAMRDPELQSPLRPSPFTHGGESRLGIGPRVSGGRRRPDPAGPFARRVLPGRRRRHRPGARR